jgi:hypothetical protein
MLHDRVRMEAFQRAIFAAVEHLVRTARPTNEHPLRVLDVGTGYGILSYWAVEAVRKYCGSTLDEKGALPVRVYAVEGNPVTAGEAYERLDERRILWKGVKEPGEVLVLNTTSYRVPEYLSENKSIVHRFDPELHAVFESTHSFKNFDLIISETLGSIGDNEDIVSILDHAIENFLEPEGLVIPFHIRSFLVPIESPLIESNTCGDLAEIGVHQAVACSEYHHKISEYYLPRVSNSFDMVFDSIIPSSDDLSQAVQLKEWQFKYTHTASRDRSRTKYTVEISYPIIKTGLFSGFKGFFMAELVNPEVVDQHITIDISSDNIDLHTTSDCWKHLYLPIENQVAVNDGDEIKLNFTRITNREGEDPGFSYQWRGSVERLGQKPIRFCQNHRITTPFMVREPLVSRFVEGFAYSLEAAHLEDTVIPKTDFETKQIIKHSLANSVWEGLQNLRSANSNSTQRARKDLGARKNALGTFVRENLSDPRLEKCFLAFPSIESPKSYVLVSAGGNEASFDPEGAWMVVYTVDPDHHGDLADFINVTPHQPYFASSLESTFTEVLKREGAFASALLIPKNVYAKLSFEDIKDLRTLMYELHP